MVKTSPFLSYVPVYTLEQPPKLNVFGHCYLISRLAKSLELAVNAEKVAKTFGASKRLCHALKMQYADGKNALLNLLVFVFLVSVTSSVN